MSNVSKRRNEGSRTKIKSVGEHKDFLNRITKTLYYGQLPTLPCLSLPVTEISCAAWSLGAGARGRSVRRLHADAAARVARQACASPCALVLALLYLERLHAANRRYLAHVHPQDLFLVSLMVGNKFLQDDGEDDEVICSEWAESGGIDLEQLKKLEIEFLNAIDWKVFVGEASFEAGLSRLERAVALRQGAARGFFTYSDLAAAGGGAGGAGAAAAACAALALAYVAGLLALLAGALLAPHAAHQLAARLAPPARPAPALRACPGNASLEVTLDADALDALAAELLSAQAAAEQLRGCAGCAAPAPPAPGRRARAPLWSWVCRSSLVDPLQLWLGRLDEYAELAARGWRSGGGGGRELAAGGLGALLAVSDR